MKAMAVVLLVVCSVVTCAQTNTAPSADLTMAMSAGTPRYCGGESAHQRGAGGSVSRDDITLLLPLKLLYQNHRSETMLLPRGYSYLVSMTVAGQSGTTIVRRGGGGAFGLDVKSLTAASRPTEGFSILAGGKDASSKVPEYSVLKFKDTVDEVEFARIPVVDRSSEVDLRGKTVQLVASHDFRSSIPPELVPKLNEKWKDYGVVWNGVAESEPLTFRIPDEPLTLDCRTAPAMLPSQLK